MASEWIVSTEELKFVEEVIRETPYIRPGNGGDILQVLNGIVLQQPSTMSLRKLCSISSKGRVGGHDKKEERMSRGIDDIMGRIMSTICVQRK